MCVFCGVCFVAYVLSYVFVLYVLSHVFCRMCLVLCVLSYVLSYVFCSKCFVVCVLWYVLSYVWYVFCPMCFAICVLSYMFCQYVSSYVCWFCGEGEQGSSVFAVEPSGISAMNRINLESSGSPA